jgi:quercetin dioxygenase-like cupin family protein
MAMADQPHRTRPALHRRALPGHGWAEVERLPYKEDERALFRAVSRQVLFADPAMAGELRYFEVAPGGFSTLERHEHAHAVLVLQGGGRCLVGQRVIALAPLDLVSVPPWTWHQFRAGGRAPLGFLCLVDAVRDRPSLPDAADLAGLRADPAIAAFLDGRDEPG